MLDLGCGKALTSIFLAREYGVHVVAADLRVPPHENWARVREAGCADSVMPLHAEAHDLKFAEGYFDAILSVDAYHYFDTDQLYLSYLTRFLRPGGVLGIALPALVEELADNEVPEHLAPYWSADWWTFTRRSGGSSSGSAARCWRSSMPICWRMAGVIGPTGATFAPTRVAPTAIGSRRRGCVSTPAATSVSRASWPAARLDQPTSVWDSGAGTWDGWG